MAAQQFATGESEENDERVEEWESTTEEYGEYR